MPRLGRRDIILSLCINSLNIALYLIIFIAACFNITEASVNFIILNAFAACFACLLIISEIRLPQLTYEYFRFLCTYRGRGVTYLFFGCMVASRIPFTLYGGIIVVCMGLVFIVLSFMTLIPPLDGLILNYNKLDQWKAQKRFRVQLEAQRIFEQQLQQEQSLTQMVPAHHTNTLTTHANMTLSSPKQVRGSSYFNGASVSVGTRNDTRVVSGAPTALFSPPMSPAQPRDNGYQHSLMQSPQQSSILPASFTLSPPPTRRQSAVRSDPGSPLQYLHVDKDDPYEAVDSFSSIDFGKKTECESDFGQMTKYAEPSETDAILKSAPDTTNVCADHYPQRLDHHQSHQRYQQQRQKSGQDKLPLRTINKPTPPHDPFRRASIPSNSTNKSAAVEENDRQRCQSLYQPPEPQQNKATHSLHYPLHVHPHSHYYQEPMNGTLELKATSRILPSIGVMSGRYGIASSAPGALVAGKLMPTSWRHEHEHEQARRKSHQDQDQEMQTQEQRVRHLSIQQQQRHRHQSIITITENNCDPSMGSNQYQDQDQYQRQHSSKQQQRQHQQKMSDRAGALHMPDIVLTLPTPAEAKTGQSSRREEYFAM